MPTPQNSVTLPDRTSLRALLGSSSVPTIADFSNDSFAGTAEDAPIASGPQNSASTQAPTPQSTSSNTHIQVSSGIRFGPNERPFRLPGIIQVINETRQVVGMQEFSAYRLFNSTQPLRPHNENQSSVPATSQSARKLRDNLEHIFQSFQVSTDYTVYPEETQRTEIINWANELNDLLVSFQSSLSSLPKQTVNDLIAQLIALLETLNQWIEQEHDAHKRLFYEASEPRLDAAFGRMKSLSVRCHKEIEESRMRGKSGDRGWLRKKAVLHDSMYCPVYMSLCTDISCYILKRSLYIPCALEFDLDCTIGLFIYCVAA